VLAALQRYDDYVDEVNGGGRYDFERVKAVAAEPFATQQAKTLLANQSSGYVVVGRTRATVRDVSIEADRATVVSCVDAADVFLAVSGTTTPIPGYEPQPPGLSTTTLVRRAGTWLVSDVTGRDGC
jgi:hypothetical protein